MTILFTNINSLVTMAANGALYKAGEQMQDIGEIQHGALCIDDHSIKWVGTASEASAKLENLELIADEVIDCTGKTLLPGFVDSHTHMVFAGNRSDEFARRLRGTSYQEIAAEGGGILKTMRSVRESSVEELAATAIQLVLTAMKHGTTAVEIKSGYGLDIESELKQLRAIRLVKEEMPVHVVATFLGAHDIPPEYRDNRQRYIDILCEEMIPAVAEEQLAEFCDVFTDTGYYTVQETERILLVAQQAGMKLKIHADELTYVGAAELAGKLGCASADHLLNISDDGIDAMRNGNSIGTLLPGTAYFLGLPYAPARRMVQKGMALALATDCNPGSCFTENMQLILSLACTQMKMTMEEALCAATLNGAAAVGLSHTTGSLEPGKSADFLLVSAPSYTNVMYHFGVNHVRETWIRGRREIANY